jgi:hypothetical protein
VSLRPAYGKLASTARWRLPLSLPHARISFRLAHFSRTQALNAAVYRQMMISIPAGQTGIWAGDECPANFYRSEG